MLTIDTRALVSRADLLYRRPAGHPVQGQPIGNGRMGSMVWTTPGAIHFQINRSDVFSVNKCHQGPYEDTADYCSACAQVTLALGDSDQRTTAPLAPGPAFSQQLALYDAECTVNGEGVRVRCFVSAVADVLVLEIDDQRPHPQPLRLILSLWHPPEVRTGEHLARYAFGEQESRLWVTRQFSEGAHYCAATVAAQVVGADGQVDAPDERTRVRQLPAARGKRTLLLASAASWSPAESACTQALALLDQAAGQPYAALRGSHTRWWADFWARTFVHLHSADGLADFMERVRTLHLYYMASSSRGAFPPKWNGSLFTTDGDRRAWGSQFWVWTTEMHYFPLLAADAADLCEPYFRMYTRQLKACQQAARQRWGVAGAFYPETTPFDGPVVLPEDSVEEYRETFLGRRPADRLSERTRGLCSYEHHLRTLLYLLKSVGAGRFSWISHLASSVCELAVQAWWRYRYTGDLQWLRACAYPLLREAAEFYRGLAVRAEDGCYHLHGLNQHEDFWGVSDGIWDLAAVRGTVPLALRAAELLETDTALRPVWRELLNHLVPYPMGNEPQAQALTGGVLAGDVWAAGYLGEANGQHNPEDVWLTPVFPFEDWTLETQDPAVDRIVRELVAIAPRMRSILQGEPCNTTIRTPIAAVRAGCGENLPAMLAAYYTAFGPLPNGWSLFEGSGQIENQAHSIEPLGCISTVLQEALLQSVSPHPGEPEVLRLFPAWPQEWDASFRLLARGGFMAESSRQDGRIEPVDVTSRLGEECRLRNPWGTACWLAEGDGEARLLEGDVLRFATTPGGRYLLWPQDMPRPQQRTVALPATDGLAGYTSVLPGGSTVSATLGIHDQAR